MAELYLYHREKLVKTLGPGNRYVLWVQGCPHNCKGCIVAESHSSNEGGEYIDVKSILKEIAEERNLLTGVTISGGEPFMQSKALKLLLKGIVERGLDVICYTGFLYEELKDSNNKDIQEMLRYIDILIDGKYIEELNTGSYLRGSDNQRIIHLKNTYKKYEKLMNSMKNRNVEFKVKDNKTIFIAGIPPLNLNEQLDGIMQKLYE